MLNICCKLSEWKTKKHPPLKSFKFTQLMDERKIENETLSEYSTNISHTTAPHNA